MVSILELTQLDAHGLIYQFFLPFILTYTVFFATLQMLPLFPRKINFILALVITLIIAASPMFATIVNYISQFGVFTALGAFIVIFVIGVAAWSYRRSREYVTGKHEGHYDLERVEKEIGRLENKLKKARYRHDERKIRKYENQLSRLYERHKVLERTT